MKKYLLFFIYSLLLIKPLLSDNKKDNTKTNETIVVTAAKIPIKLNDTGRNLIIISRKDIENSPATNITELLKYIAGTDLRRRGISDMQADISLRGAGFEQSLIMIDGIKFNNPQTGHHNLDLPIQIDDIERIEILKGHGSSSFGANAVGGIINIITKSSINKKVLFSSSYGSFNTKVYGGNLSLPKEKIKTFLSFKKSISDGYRLGTEYNKSKFFGKLSYNSANLKIFFSTGYSNKKFGAYSFYTRKFPNQWENTKGGFINGNLQFNYNRYKFGIKLYHIEHNDDFILDRNNPSWYRNKHKTDVNGLEYQFSFWSKLGITAIGGNIEKDSIISNSLGNHERKTLSFFAEQKKDITEKLYFDISLYLYHYSNWGWKFLPSIVLNYKINNTFDVFFNMGNSFRTPTYTELYYSSPANRGNQNLFPEQSFEFETGLKIDKKFYRLNFSFFKRFSKNMIDWVRTSPNSIWKAENISKIKTTGIELSLNLPFHHKFINNMRINYTNYISSLSVNSIETKYILDNLKEQLLIQIKNRLFFSINQIIEFRHNKRISGYKYTTIDTSFYKKIGSISNIFLKINNITNKYYIETGGIPMPGIWFLTGIKIGV
jgi:iron complex outermembrane receptor protein